MKKLLLIMLCMIFLIGNVSFVSSSDFDDCKWYNDETTTYTIRNLCIGTKIADLELKTPHNNLVARGYQKVAEIEIRNGEYDYEEIINGIELYNIKDDMKEIIKDVDYKYLNPNYPNYKVTCVDKENDNKTIYQECSSVQKEVQWIDFTNNSLLKGENITLGIFTDVQKGDYIEWIINVYGSERLTKWATWSQSLQASLISYHNLDETAGVTAEDELEANDLTNYDSVEINMPGKDGQSYNFTGTNTMALKKATKPTGFTNTAVSGSIWVYLDDADQYDGVMSISDTGEQNKTHIMFITTTILRLNSYNAGQDHHVNTDFSSYFGKWTHIAWSVNESSLELWLDGVSKVRFDNTTWNLFDDVDNMTIGNYPTATSRSMNGRGDSVGWWARMFDQDDVSELFALGGEYQLENISTINLDNPANTTNFTTNDITFNATIFDNTNITNVSFILDNQYNETNTTAGVNNSVYTFNKIISEGDHWWTMEACNFDDNCVNVSQRTFGVDTINPAVVIITPNETTNHHLINTNIFFNWSANDTNLDACIYGYEGANTTVTCSDNTTTINITNSINRTITFWVNDTFGHMNSTSRTWVYRVFESQPTFNPTTIEGTLETYIANVTLGTGESISLVNLSYNNRGQTVSLVDLGGNIFNLTSTFLVPQIGVGINATFFWIIDLNSGVQVNTTSYNQTVNNLSIDDCTIYTTLIFNYTIVDEENQTKLTGTDLELSINISDTAKTTEVLNFSFDYGATNPAAVCININLTENAVYALDSTVKYEGTDHVIEYYNLQNFILRNSTIPQRITLYDLLSADSTEFQITFKDSNFVAVEDAIIHINRQYVSEGLFKTVEIPKTDSNGQTVAHLVEKDVVYNLIVLKEGVVLGTFNNIIAFCEDVLVGSCFISLNALEIGEEVFDYDEEIGLISSFDYNETTRNLQFAFSTVDGSVKNVSLSAVKIDQLGNDTICSPFLTSASGSLYCPVPISVGNESIIVEIFVNGDLKITNYISAGRAFDIGDAGYFLMFFLVLSIALMMTQSKTGVIIGVLVGFIASILLSFAQGGIVGIGSSTIWLGITAVILIWKLNSQGQT